MKKLFIALAIISSITIIYVSGPAPKLPLLDGKLPVVENNLLLLEQQIKASEASNVSIRKDNESRIIWFDSTSKEKTPVSFVYLHGFSASQAEGAPVHTNIAKKFGANIYLSRLAQHGMHADSAFKELTPEELLDSAKKAIAIGKAIGNEVIIISTSTGASLASYICSKSPRDIKAMVLYSPLIELYNKSSFVIDKPWGIQVMRAITGSDFMEFERPPEVQQYWTTKYMLEGLITLKSLISNTMTKETFSKIRCPVFLGYYYKDEENQDKTVSVAAMLDMYEWLGTDPSQKRSIAFPEAGHHVISSYLTSRDYMNVERETIGFLEEIVGLESITSQK